MYKHLLISIFCLYVCLAVCLPDYLYMCLTVCMCVWLSVCFSVPSYLEG